MGSKIMIVNGNPSAASYSSALAEAYERGATASGAEVRSLHLGSLTFDPILKHGYQQRMELEDDLLRAQEIIKWGDHLVFVYPIWWGTTPALLKGFFDRVLLPGFAYQTRPNSMTWDKLLKGRSARLIVTLDTPSWYNRLLYKRAGHQVVRRNVLQFCGINPVRITELSPINSSTEQQRAKWLTEVEELGRKRG
ncbi:NAD(P)H-dependent oxidoreductase [Paenibacillus sp. GCM10023252]|uniref:NAD(P)H-dependent oxidoreductase n=1 Tax=Paenibacillus sp. GCM10023252 TaxID=3252649 RepID=UPI003612192F